MNDTITSRKECPLPQVVADRFPSNNDKHFAWPIPEIWKDAVVEWTERLSKLDPNFMFLQIREKYGNARVHARGDFRNWDGKDYAIRAMEIELDALIEKSQLGQKK